MPSSWSDLALVVPTLGRPDALTRMLASVAAQSVVPGHVVIVDATQPSVASQVTVPKGLNVRWVAHQPPSASGQRNRGIRELEPLPPWIMFLDDDCLLEPGAMEALRTALTGAPAQVGGLGLNWMDAPIQAAQALKRSGLMSRLGFYAARPGAVAPSGWQSVVGRVEEDLAVDWLPSGAVVWRAAALAGRGFDESYGRYSYLEDLEFSYARRGTWELRIAAGAGFRHIASTKARVSHQRFGRAEVVNRWRFVKRHGLSRVRCVGMLVLRGLMSTALGLVRVRPDLLERALGNLEGVLELWRTPRRERRA